MEPNEEARLIARVRAGDREAYAPLVRAHQEAVFRLALSMLSDESEAEEAVQETFLKAYRALAKFRGDSAFSTWLYRLASNQCLDSLRKRTRRKTESWDELVEKEGERIERLLSSPGDFRASEGDGELARRLLAQLPEEYRLILTLREIQGLSYEEVAEAMDCTLDSVKARLRRARAALEEKARHFLGPGGV